MLFLQLASLFLMTCWLYCFEVAVHGVLFDAKKFEMGFYVFWQILLPTVVMLLLIAVRTRVDTQIHPAQP